MPIWQNEAKRRAPHRIWQNEASQRGATAVLVGRSQAGGANRQNEPNVVQDPSLAGSCSEPAYESEVSRLFGRRNPPLLEDAEEATTSWAVTGKINVSSRDRLGSTFSCRCGAVGAEAAMTIDRLALRAAVRQNIGMTEDEGEKTQ